MGVGPKISCSTYDYVDSPNPNPSNFKIIKRLEINNFIILMVKYHGCTNYEGTKILVYQGVSWETLSKQKTLDPHFSESIHYHSPIARFVPTEEGWEYAKLFCSKGVHL